MDARLASFAEDVAMRYSFLVDEFGFVGPDASEEGYVGFSLPPWWVWIVLEERNNTVDTFLQYDGSERVLRAPMRSLVAKAQLGGIGLIRDSAQTRVGMRKSLSNQAEALRRLTPVLLSEGSVLMES